MSSSALYPIGLISKIQVQPFNAVIADEFEAGNTSTRLLWGANNFKHKLRFTHSPLTLAEYRYLRSFYAARSGGANSFWIRDNPNRTGNYEVRFSAPVGPERDSDFSNVEVSLDEIAPQRALIEIEDVTLTSPSAPVFWYDPNKGRTWLHMGVQFYEATLFDAALTNPYIGVFQAGTLKIAGLTSQYQSHTCDGTLWTKSANNIAEITGAQPACTLFAFVKQSASASKQVLFALGATAGGSALGLALAADGRYEPWLGGAEVWTNARKNNSAADTWRSIALVWTGASNNVSLYANAALVGTDTVTRSLTAGPVSFAASPTGTLIANPGNAMANCQIAHAMAFASAFTLAQVKALHNLLCAQYGVASV